VWERLKGAAWVALGIAFLLGMSLLVALFVHGGAWVGAKAYPWLSVISRIALLGTVCILLPLAVFRGTRRFSGNGLILASYVFGLTLWVWGLLLTYVLWGPFAVFVGLFLVGVGVVPIAMVATSLKGMWSTFGELAFLVVLTFGTRLFGAFLSDSGIEG